VKRRDDRASTPLKPISSAKAITVERAALSFAQVNTAGFFAARRLADQ